MTEGGGYGDRNRDEHGEQARPDQSSAARSQADDLQPDQSRPDQSQPGQYEPGQPDPGQPDPGRSQFGQSQFGEYEPAQPQFGPPQPGQSHQFGGSQPGQSHQFGGSQPVQSEFGQSQPAGQPGQFEPGQYQSGERQPDWGPGQRPDQGAEPTQAFGDRNPSGQQPAQTSYPSAPPPYGQYQPTAQQQTGQYAPQYGQYGQPPGQYGQYGQYGQNPWAAPPGFGRPQAPLASWGSRAGALLLDGLFALLVWLPAIVVFGVAAATADTRTEPDGTTTINNINGGLIALGVVLGLIAICWQFWNHGWRQGSEGWSWGKQVVGMKLVGEQTLQPPGGWTGIGRFLVRGILGNVTAGIYTVLTYLWPLWDDKNQTLDDKIFSTLVVRTR